MNINHKNIISGFFFVLVIFVLAQLYYIFRPFFEAFFWAGILAFAFFPLHKAVQRVISKPVPAAFVSTLLIVLIVILPSAVIIERLVAQGIDLYEFLSNGGWERVVEALRNSPSVQKYYAMAADLFTRYFGDVSAKVGPAL